MDNEMWAICQIDEWRTAKDDPDMVRADIDSVIVEFLVKEGYDDLAIKYSKTLADYC